jgi:hypothetical protein
MRSLVYDAIWQAGLVSVKEGGTARSRYAGALTPFIVTISMVTVHLPKSCAEKVNRA